MLEFCLIGLGSLVKTCSTLPQLDNININGDGTSQHKFIQRYCPAIDTIQPPYKSCYLSNCQGKEMDLLRPVSVFLYKQKAGIVEQRRGGKKNSFCHTSLIVHFYSDTLKKFYVRVLHIADTSEEILWFMFYSKAMTPKISIFT